MVAIFLIIFLSPAVLAAGLGVGPSTLQVNNAVRGEDYKQIFLVQNPSNQEGAYSITATGEAALWLSFWKLQTPNMPANTVTIPATGEASIQLNIDVPTDAIDGKYEATIMVANTAAGITQDGTSVQLAAQVELTVTVNGGDFIPVPVATTLVPNRAGVLTATSFQGETVLGSRIKILAQFTNTGDLDTKARFVGDAYCDGKPFDRIISDEVLVPVGQTATLTSLLKLDATGVYQIKGYVDYEGKKTDVNEIAFTVTEGSAGGSQTPSLLTPQVIMIMSGICAVLIFGIYIVGFVLGKKQRKR